MNPEPSKPCTSLYIPVYKSIMPEHIYIYIYIYTYTTLGLKVWCLDLVCGGWGIAVGSLVVFGFSFSVEWGFLKTGVPCQGPKSSGTTRGTQGFSLSRMV